MKINVFNNKRQPDEIKQAAEVTSNKGLYKSDNWEFYHYYYDKTQMVSIRFDMEAVSNQAAYKTCLRLIIYLDPKTCLADGLPEKEEYRKLITLEEKMLGRIQSDTWFVGRMLYSCLIDFVFQTNNSEVLKKELEQVASNIFSINKYTIDEKEGWGFFNNKVSPKIEDRQMIIDRKLIGELVKVGANPDAEHILNHSISGDNKKLQDFSRQLHQDGFTINSIQDGRLKVSKPSRLYLNEISSVTSKFAGYCNSIGLQYEGWATFASK